MSCKQCGACCKYVVFITEGSMVDHEWYKARQIEVIPIGDGIQALKIHNTCTHLDGTNHCTIYKDRPISCRAFPLGARYVLPECRFSEAGQDDCQETT